MTKGRGSKLAIIALVIYVIGGVATFGGLGLVVLMKGRDLLGMGDGRGIGLVFLCVGLCLSIFGVLLMRIFRNRSGL
jgi:hypothetical protein